MAADVVLTAVVDVDWSRPVILFIRSSQLSPAKGEVIIQSIEWAETKSLQMTRASL